ncbi:MAG TPA: FprA family A-type flavoprotein, partial [Anaerohalosphaeraceae bacterium]|nr:FprA family A-type flavoprotein [Anaerohalosphaeraceae bacterium]
MRALTKNVYSVGVQDWDRRLFDELIPLPDGTSYNAYLIKGSEKTALIDAVDPAKIQDLISHLVGAGVDKLDYVISHHAEQDHSGGIVDVLMMYPDAKIVTNAKCKGLLLEHLDVDEEQFIEVAEGQTLSLGDKTLQFIITPWVHWPETMCTYLKEDKILFSCDFFGSHQATSSVFVQDEAKVYEAAKRYFAEIMMPFRSAIAGNLKKLEPLEIAMIAPSHGPVYPRPALIMEAYKDWISDRVENKVIVAYVSMHDSTRRMVEYLVDSLMDKGVGVKQYNLTGIDLGHLAIDLVDAATVILAAPTVLVGPHPTAAHAAFVVNALKPKTKFAGIIGSYGWGSKLIETL